jgi:hypothetical protein
LLKFQADRAVEAVVASCRVFSGADAAARERATRQFVSRALAPGATLFRPGEVLDALVVVISGDLCLAEPDCAFRPSRTTPLGEGDYAVVTAALDAAPLNALAVTRRGATVRVLQRALRGWVSQLPRSRDIRRLLPGPEWPFAPSIWWGHARFPG